MTNLPDFTTQGYQTLEILRSNIHGGRITYKAVKLDNQQLVVIKQIKFITGSLWSDFDLLEQESEILKQINHPYIPRYLGSFQTDDSFCLVQEYKEAKPLSDTGKLDLSEIKDLTISLLEILVYLQQQQPPIIHRDIKPENILYSSDGQVYLIDFGFARVGTNNLGTSSTVKGTMGFMPPEQIFNRPLSEASDLYSLGVTIICLLTQTSSLEIGNLIDSNFKIKFEHLVPDLNQSLKDWLSQMVESNINDRFANAKIALESFKKLSEAKENSTVSVNLDQAFKILDLPKKATFKQIKDKYRQLVKIYHPDIPKTGDPQRFILICAAFTILQEHYLGNKNETKLADEVIFATKIRENIEKSFQEITNSYYRKKEKLTKKVPEYIRRRINSASSSHKLEKIIKEDITEYLVNAFKEIEFYLKKLIDKAKSEDKHFLNNLFTDLYIARRNYWILNLYKKPIIIFTFIGILIQIILSFTIVTNPLINSILLIFSPLIMLLSIIIYIIIKLIKLNPRHQFIPPSFSLSDLSSSLEKVSGKLDIEREANAFGNAIGLGTLLGLSAFIPAVGPALGIGAGIFGAVTGGLFGFLSGKSLQEIKDEAYENIIQKFYDAIEQIDGRMEIWISSSKEEVLKVTEESFAQNLYKISNLLTRKQLPKNLTEQPLLLPSKIE